MDIEQLAWRQLADYDRHDPGRLFEGYFIPMTVDGAYALQMAVARLREQRGERVAGYKVGCTSQTLRGTIRDRPPRVWVRVRHRDPQIWGHPRPRPF